MKKFSVGDRVRIRQWDDMANEFGVNPRGSILCKFIFLDSMKFLCGREFIITRISYDGCIEGHSTLYSISEDMIEFVSGQHQDDDDFTPDGFVSILKGVCPCE